MGGKAFSSGPDALSTPRMEPEIYFAVRDEVTNCLRSLFQDVATPLEAPGKSSYGDIDILVSNPLRDGSTSDEVLTLQLKAIRSAGVHNAPTKSFAVPFPAKANQFIQVDVHVSPPDSFKWQVFHQSHGDLWNLLGTTIRPFGLTATHEGLHLRIEEIEPCNRKRSLIFLTKEPREVVRFLGLDVGRYDKPFPNVEALYAFVVSCRFFNAASYVKSGLEANDRKRMSQREAYRDFVVYWAQKHNQTGVMVERSTPSRVELVSEVLQTFGKSNGYQTRLEQWRSEQSELMRTREAKAARRQNLGGYR